MIKIKLNENDHKLLGFCENIPRSIGEIAKFLNISPASVSIKVQRLKEAGLIKVNKKGQGKKTLIRTSKGDKTNQHFINILKELVRVGGEVKEENFLKILPFNIEDPEEYDRSGAVMKLLFLRPSLVERVIRITPEGKRFLKDKE